MQDLKSAIDWLMIENIKKLKKNNNLIFKQSFFIFYSQRFTYVYLILVNIHNLISTINQVVINMNKHMITLHERLSEKHMTYFLNKSIVFCEEIIEEAQENNEYIENINIMILLLLSDNITNNSYNIIIWSESSLSLDTIFDDIVKHLKMIDEEEEIAIDKSHN